MATRFKLEPLKPRTPLARLRDVLKGLGVDVDYEPAVDARQVDALFVTLGVDRHKPIVLRAVLLNEIAQAAGIGTDESDIVFLMMQIELPTPVSADADRLQVDASINLINQMCYIGGMTYFPDQRVISYRYTLASPTTEFDERVVFDVLVKIRGLLLDMTEPLHNVMRGMWDAEAFEKHLREELQMAPQGVLSASGS